MTVTREQVFQALFSALQAPAIADLVTTFSRRFSPPDQIQPLAFPQLMLWEQSEKTEYSGPQMPRKRAWSALIVVYFQNTSKTVPGATIINPIMDAIEATLRYDNPATNALTLGGLVTYCRIEGQTIKETGDTDANGIGGAVIPIRILIP
jgi:hypothetical protein